MNMIVDDNIVYGRTYKNQDYDRFAAYLSY